jgi:hypothetical protein
VVITAEHRRRYRAFYDARQPAEQPRPNPWTDAIEAVAAEVAATSVLDYGSGIDRALERTTALPVRSYDPGVAGYDQEPVGRHSVVVCTHAIEHVERRLLGRVLADLYVLTDSALFFVASCSPSTKVLNDGTPWHTSVLTPDEWRAQLAVFDFARVVEPAPRHKGEYAAVCYK